MLNMKFKLGKLAKIYMGVILLQFCFAGNAIIAKLALNQGTSHYTFSVYRNAIAAVVFSPLAFVLERKLRPKMTVSILCKIMLLALLDPIIGQNLFYAGMSYTTATFTTAMCNVLPGLTFVLAWILRVEQVNLKEIHSHAKIVGTLVTIGGAMIMTLVGGPALALPWTKHKHANAHSSTSINNHYSPIKGAIMIAAGNIGYSLFFIFQSITLKSYPAGLSLTSLICAFGALQGVALTFVVERGNISIWSIGWDAKLLAYAYGGIISSGVIYFVSGVIMKYKGPVFVTAFSPLSIVIVAVLSSFIIAEQLDVGMITGALVIIIGLYLVVWGKSKDQPPAKQIEQGEKQETNLSEEAQKSNSADASLPTMDSNVV